MNQKKIRMLVPVVGGILLILAGIVFLLDNLGLIVLDWEMLIGPLFALGGLVFLIVFMLNTADWWALIPGFVLLGLGITTFMGQYLTDASDRFGGAVFLGFIALPFLLIFITHSEHWWALIPGGVLLTLAGVSLVPDFSVFSGGIFFLGLSLTFVLVYLLTKSVGRQQWALYPAGILFLIGTITLLGAADLINFIWPVALLIAGAVVLFKALKH